MTTEYHIPRESFVAAYRRSCEKDPDFIRKKVELALKSLRSCTVCPHNCRIDRLKDERCTCQTGRCAKVSSAFPHRGEERGISGWNGSGTIFFSCCNLKCVFCQNYELSRGREGNLVDAQQLAESMLELQDSGCHNINFVTPSHVVPQIIEALSIAVDQGLFIPLVYNSSAYDSIESLKLLDGLVDIYMPDVKFMDAEKSRTFMAAEDYPLRARAALREMHRQAGPLCFDGEGLAVRGVLVRHLVMPDNLEDSKEIFRFLAEEVSPDTWLNVMAQYRPAGKVQKHPDRFYSIARSLRSEEYQKALELARNAGLHRLENSS
ncbi:radical SAM protein [Balneolaceae bacterium ANBcel3]|nr:radical SAM protein [Balneolaceae bacterium ANBcel3]